MQLRSQCDVWNEQRSIAKLDRTHRADVGAESERIQKSWHKQTGISTQH